MPERLPQLAAFTPSASGRFSVSSDIVGLIHPPQIVSSVTTGTWTIVHLMTIAMSFFGLLGIAGIYARQVKAAGWFGLSGFLLLRLWFVLVTGFTFFEAFILPLLANNARFVASPILVTVHIVSVTLCSLLGALQFVPSLVCRIRVRFRPPSPLNEHLSAA